MTKLTGHFARGTTKLGSRTCSYIFNIFIYFIFLSCFVFCNNGYIASMLTIHDQSAKDVIEKLGKSSKSIFEWIKNN